MRRGGRRIGSRGSRLATLPRWVGERWAEGEDADERGLEGATSEGAELEALRDLLKDGVIWNREDRRHLCR